MPRGAGTRVSVKESEEGTIEHSVGKQMPDRHRTLLKGKIKKIYKEGKG
jgi:hypothetical protein